MSSSSQSQESVAWALLALKSAPSSSTKLQWSPESKGTVIARLKGPEFEYMVRQKRIIIGRNSSLGEVDVNLGHCTFISRNHLELFFEHPNFYMVCNSKNGVFVEGVFQIKGHPQLQLPKQCTFGFPCTTIELMFQSLVNETDSPLQLANKSTSRPPLPPLRINIPDPSDTNFTSPFPSPSSTISATNSCPASPLGGHGRRNVSADTQMEAVYAAAVTGPVVNTVTVSTSNPHDSSGEILLDGSGQMSENESKLFRSTNGCPPPINEPYSPPKRREGGQKDTRPPYSYEQLIVQAMASAEDKQMTLSEIYSYITKNYPYYRNAKNKEWQNSIRRNLRGKSYFIKVPISKEDPGRGSFWLIDPKLEAQLIEDAFRRRHCGVRYFRVPFGLSYSAANSCPASPRGGHDRRNVSTDPQMAAVYAAAVARPVVNTVTVSTSNPHDSSGEILLDGSGQMSENVSKLFRSTNGCPPPINEPHSPPKRGELGQEDTRPPYSYSQMIVQAMASAEDKQITASEIYSYITKNYPYYRTANKGWKNSIRHNLSHNGYFIKVPRSQEEPGIGSFWRINPHQSEAELIEYAFRRQR